MSPGAWPVLSLAQAHAVMTAPGTPFEIADAVVRGQAVRIWKNAPSTMRDVFVAARAAHGARAFLVYEDERASVEAFARATLTLAHAMAAMGVVKGDRVAVAMRNLPEWPVAVMATLLLGAIATPLNAWGTGPELAYGLRDSGAKVALVDAERWARIEPLLTEAPALQRVLVSRSAGPLTAGLAQALASIIGPTSGWSALA